MLLRVAFLALSTRVAWWILVNYFGSGSFMWFDSPQYTLLAENLMNYGEFSRSESAPFFPDIARTPGYPVFLLPFFALGISLSGIALIQSLVSAAIPILTFDIAHRLGMPNSKLAAGISLFDLSLLLFCPVILSDGLFVTLLVLFVWLLIRSREKASLLFVAAAVTGVMILVRPIAQFLPLVMLVWIAWSSKSLKRGVVFFLVAMVLPSGWMLRNKSTFDVWTLSSMGLNNLMLYNAAGAEASAKDVNFTTIQHAWMRRALNSQEWEKDPLATKKYLAWMKENALETLGKYPGAAAKESFKSLAFYFIKPPRSFFDKAFDWNYSYDPIMGFGKKDEQSALQQFFNKTSVPGSILTLIQLAINLITLILALRGFFWLWKKHRHWAMLFIVLVGYFWALSVFTQTDARFRVPVVPFLALLAAGNLPWKIRKA